MTLVACVLYRLFSGVDHEGSVLMPNLLGYSWFCTGSCFGIIFGVLTLLPPTQSPEQLALINQHGRELSVYAAYLEKLPRDDKICEISAPK